MVDKITKIVTNFDCGNRGCMHPTSMDAKRCIDRTTKGIKKELRNLNIFIRYMGTRIPAKILGKRYNCAACTIHTIVRRTIVNFINNFFTEYALKTYGSDISIKYAVNNKTFFWLDIVKERITVINHDLDILRRK